LSGRRGTQHLDLELGLAVAGRGHEARVLHLEPVR
jgi:hypothetical protein